ncbi:hypothetical protein WFP68_00450 [Yersinia enterocolitica]
MSEIKQYDTEVRLEAVMGTNHYGVHIHAMTTEDLHSKSGIAVELAWRDLRIEQLIAQLEAAQGNIKELESKVNHYVAAEYAHKHFDQTPDIIKRADSAELELVKAEAALSAANEKHSWIKCSDKMPDPSQQHRVCVFTPNSAADLRYRLVPANLFKAVCSSATHWHYVNDPVEVEQ